MTDKQLLEYAAKAAGLNIKAYRVDINDDFTHLVVGRKNTKEKIDWNPLTDDGDALRLAVKLGLLIDVSLKMQTTDAGTSYYVCELHRNSDPYAATRRAITRAAAEIGKGME